MKKILKSIMPRDPSTEQFSWACREEEVKKFSCVDKSDPELIRFGQKWDLDLGRELHPETTHLIVGEVISRFSLYVSRVTLNLVGNH